MTKSIEMEGIEMSDSEKKTINDLRAKLSADLEPKIYDDTYMLYRFLYAHSFNINNAENMIRKMLQWRRQMRLDSLISDNDIHEVLRKYIGETRFTTAKNSTPVHYLPLGKLDVKGILSSCKYVEIEKRSVQIMETDEQVLLKKRKSEGGPYPGFIFIFDMDGLDFATATDKKGVETVIKFLKVYQNYYPERLEKIFVINASPFFYIPFAIIKNFLDACLIKRMHIHGADGWKEELLKIIDDDKLPVFLGGKKTDPDGNPLCKTSVCQGGKVEERFYLPKNKKSLSSSPGVQKLVLARASFSEIEVEIEESGSLIEWEFETKTRDIGFGLFHKETTEGGEEKITELVPLLRLDTDSYAETGMYKCEQAGTYVILFDNSYSWIRSKEIYYRTKIISPKEHENQLL